MFIIQTQKRRWARRIWTEEKGTDWNTQAALEGLIGKQIYHLCLGGEREGPTYTWRQWSRPPWHSPRREKEVGVGCSGQDSQQEKFQREHESKQGFLSPTPQKNGSREWQEFKDNRVLWKTVELEPAFGLRAFLWLLYWMNRRGFSYSSHCSWEKKMFN